MQNDFGKKSGALTMSESITSGRSSISNEKSYNSLLDIHIEHDKKEIEYNEFINNNDLSHFNTDFIYFYRNGSIQIFDNLYSVGDLYLETGMQNEEERTYLIYYKYPSNDILTGEIKKCFKRTHIMKFNNSYCFYKIFCDMHNTYINNNVFIVNDDNINIVINAIKNHDGTIHVETPETSFGKIKY